MLPTFIVIGAAKSGTSSLCGLLSEHPEVFVSDPKEPHHYSSLPSSVMTHAKYEALFDGAAGCKAIGEGSTSYTAPNRIHRAVRKLAKERPDCKFIYIVRDPVRRLESDWKMRLHEGWTPKDINKAVAHQPELVSAGMYWQNISLYRDQFPDEQIKIVFMEDMRSHPVATLKDCFRFLDVDESYVDQMDAGVRRNQSANFRNIVPGVKEITSSPVWQEVKGKIPVAVRDLGKKMLSSDYDFAIEWDPVFLDSVINELKEDAAHFLEFYGKPKDFWCFESETSAKK